MDEYYSSTAQGYDELHGEEQREKLKVILENTTISPLDRVLDVGCGSAVATKTLRCKMIGIDPSWGLLSRAPFPTVCGNGEHLPFKDRFFDKVISLSAIHHFTEPEKGIAEMLRVCKKDVIVTVLKKSAKAQKLDEMLKKHRNFRRVVDHRVDRIYLLRR
jgi:ubiquinone/menaquinone biosynthesis C-methylase UbiE